MLSEPLLGTCCTTVLINTLAWTRGQGEFSVAAQLAEFLAKCYTINVKG